MSGVALITLRVGTPDLDPAMPSSQQNPSPQQQPDYPPQSHQRKNHLQVAHQPLRNSADTFPNYTAWAASYLKMKPAHHFQEGLRILVMDADPICLLILDRMLRQCSYHVTTCGGATKALELLREDKDKFDLVISDVYMPDMDGFKLLELVRDEMDLPVVHKLVSISPFPACVVAFAKMCSHKNKFLVMFLQEELILWPCLSPVVPADRETSIVMKGITCGACNYLLKPVRIEELRNIWQHVVRKLRREPKEHSGSFEDGEINQQGGTRDADNTSSAIVASTKTISDSMDHGVKRPMHSKPTNVSSQVLLHLVPTSQAQAPVQQQLSPAQYTQQHSQPYSLMVQL
ncbi:unnamed protein product [Sphagnum balticum]